MKEFLAECGEFLSVTYSKGEQGYIFNPLLTAEQFNTVDEKLTTHDQHGNLKHFVFLEEKLKDTAIFKKHLDTFKGIFCGEQIKQACEAAHLTGVSFNPDISNLISESYGTEQ